MNTCSPGYAKPTPSKNTRTDGEYFLADSKQDLIDEPYPEFLWCLITSAPASSAVSAVASVLPSSTTTTLSAYFFDLNTTEPMLVSSLYAADRDEDFFPG
jgi:hypothetical protein